jgi:hypothetical protein
MAARVGAVSAGAFVLPRVGMSPPRLSSLRPRSKRESYVPVLADRGYAVLFNGRGE